MGYAQPGHRPASDSPTNREAPPHSFWVHKNINSDELILASDFFATTGRTVGAFSDFVPRMKTEHTVWETLTPPSWTRTGMTAGDYMQRWLADIRVSGLAVNAVFGFCVGSVFAATMVEQISTWQKGKPRLIVFDPERPHAALLHRHYGDALKIISGALSADTMRIALRAGEVATAESAGMAELASRLTDALLEIGDPALQQVGLDENRRNELLGTFGSFLSYLAVASEIDPEQTWLTATAISSATPHNGLNVVPPERRAAMVAREIRFDLQHADLLRNDDVSRAVDELLR